VCREEISAVPESSPTEAVIVATGPLTSEALSADIARLVGSSHLYFYDAISPIVLAETIDRSKVFRQSRWGRSFAAGPQGRATASIANESGVTGRDAAAVMPVCGADDGQGDY